MSQQGISPRSAYFQSLLLLLGLSLAAWLAPLGNRFLDAASVTTGGRP